MFQRTRRRLLRNIEGARSVSTLTVDNSVYRSAEAARPSREIATVALKVGTVAP